MGGLGRWSRPVRLDELLDGMSGLGGMRGLGVMRGSVE
jgi:hypothetical protein